MHLTPRRSWGELNSQSHLQISNCNSWVIRPGLSHWVSGVAELLAANARGSWTIRHALLCLYDSQVVRNLKLALHFADNTDYDGILRALGGMCTPCTNKIRNSWDTWSQILFVLNKDGAGRIGGTECSGRFYLDRLDLGADYIWAYLKFVTCIQVAPGTRHVSKAV